MFERFTDGARRAVTDAQVVARRLGHDRIGTEHVLLGILGIEDGTAVRMLARMGVSPETLEERLYRMRGRASSR